MKCAVCGLNEGLYDIEFSDNFVSYSEIFNGGKVCEKCYSLLKDQKYRRSSWIMTQDGVKTLDKSEILDMIVNAPEGSLIYVKSRGQKLAFLKALRHRSSRKYVVLCGEDEGMVLISREKLRELVDKARKAMSLGLRKKDLLEGCSTKMWAHREVCEYIEKARGDPSWRIIVRAL